MNNWKQGIPSSQESELLGYATNTLRDRSHALGMALLNCCNVSYSYSCRHKG